VKVLRSAESWKKSNPTESQLGSGRYAGKSKKSNPTEAQLGSGRPGFIPCLAPNESVESANKAMPMRVRCPVSHTHARKRGGQIYQRDNGWWPARRGVVIESVWAGKNEDIGTRHRFIAIKVKNTRLSVRAHAACDTGGGFPG